MKIVDERTEAFRQAVPAVRRRLMFSAYKHYFGSSFFPWLVLLHSGLVAAYIIASLSFYADAHGSAFGPGHFLVAVLLVSISSAVHLKLLIKYIFLKYSRYFQDELAKL